MVEKRIRIIEQPYFYCGIEEVGHYHSTEVSAEKCKHSQEFKSKHNRLKYDFAEITEMKRQGKTFKEIGNVFGVSGASIKNAIQKQATVQHEKENKDVLIKHFFDNKNVILTYEFIMSVFSTRTANSLLNMGLVNKTISELCDMGEVELLKSRMIGRKTLNEIKDVISIFGLKLKRTGGS